jgi:hypothetical protein
MMMKQLMIALVCVFVALVTTASATTTFNVAVAAKTASHPWFNQGFSTGYVVNGVEGAALEMTVGVTYTFMLNTPGHPFILTDSATGGSSASPLAGFSAASSGSVQFIPNAVGSLYYQCTLHSQMGGEVTISAAAPSPSASPASGGGGGGGGGGPGTLSGSPSGPPPSGGGGGGPGPGPGGGPGTLSGSLSGPPPSGGLQPPPPSGTPSGLPPGGGGPGGVSGSPAGVPLTGCAKIFNNEMGNPCFHLACRDAAANTVSESGIDDVDCIFEIATFCYSDPFVSPARPSRIDSTGCKSDAVKKILWKRKPKVLFAAFSPTFNKILVRFDRPTKIEGTQIDSNGNVKKQFSCDKLFPATTAGFAVAETMCEWTRPDLLELKLLSAASKPTIAPGAAIAFKAGVIAPPDVAEYAAKYSGFDADVHKDAVTFTVKAKLGPDDTFDFARFTGGSGGLAGAGGDPTLFANFFEELGGALGGGDLGSDFKLDIAASGRVGQCEPAFIDVMPINAGGRPLKSLTWKLVKFKTVSVVKLFNSITDCLAACTAGLLQCVKDCTEIDTITEGADVDATVKSALMTKAAEWTTMKSRAAFLDATLLPKGTAVKFNVTAVNWLDETTTRHVKVQRDSTDKPSIMLLDPPSRVIDADEKLYLDAQVSAGGCGGDGSAATVQSAIRFLWQQITATPADCDRDDCQVTGVNDLSTLIENKDSSSAFLGANKLMPGKTYAFQLSVETLDSAGAVATTSNEIVYVRVKRRGVSVIVDGGDSRVHSITRPLVLDASKSKDRDSTSAAPAFLWSCLKFDGDACWSSADTACVAFESTGLNKPKIEVPITCLAEIGASLNALEWILAVTSTVADENNAFKSDDLSVFVELASEAVPPVNIGTLFRDYHPVDEPLYLDAYDPTLNGVAGANFTWSCVSGCDSQFVFGDTNNFDGGVNSPFLVVKSDKLKSGASYTFRLTTYTPGVSKPGTADIKVKTASPPSGGQCTVTPATGVAGETEFTFTCNDWVGGGADSGSGLDYSYGVVEPMNADGTGDRELVFPIVTNLRVSTFKAKIPPPPPNAGEVLSAGDTTTVYIDARIRGKSGAPVYVPLSLTLSFPDFIGDTSKSIEYQDQSLIELENAIASGDANEIRRLFSAQTSLFDNDGLTFTEADQVKVTAQRGKQIKFAKQAFQNATVKTTTPANVRDNFYTLKNLMEAGKDDFSEESRQESSALLTSQIDLMFEQQSEAGDERVDESLILASMEAAGDALGALAASQTKNVNKQIEKFTQLLLSDPTAAAALEKTVKEEAERFFKKLSENLEKIAKVMLRDLPIDAPPKQTGGRNDTLKTAYQKHSTNGVGGRALKPTELSLEEEGRYETGAPAPEFTMPLEGLFAGIAAELLTDVRTLTSLNTENPFLAFEKTGESTASDIVNLEFFDKNGEKLDIKNLASPITVTIPLLKDKVLAAGKKYVCRYFDELAKEWKTDGVTATVAADLKSIVCKTDHLTSFSAGTANESSSSSDGLGGGAIAGIAVGVVVVIGAVAFLAMKGKKGESTNNKVSPA